VSAVDAARTILERAIAGRTFPAASVDVGASGGPLWSEAFGTLTFDAGSPPANVDTPFDLASLTKPIATTTIVMDLTRTGRLRLDEPVSTFFGEWRGADREHVTVRDLLEHASGLAARLVDAPPATRREFEHEICRMPLEYGPRTRSVYSDLDFILLGFLAADRGQASLSELFEQFKGRLRPQTASPDAGRTTALASLTFKPPLELRQAIAPTLPLAEDPRRGRVLVGEVHDHYAAALGGVAGHAGLFGSASDVGAFARATLRGASGAAHTPLPLSPEIVAEFTAKSAVPGSSRALGWDTMLPTSSCGTLMSPAAFGHVGFTGTSLWIDPGRDRYFVLLTNRACQGGSLDDMRAVRRSFHDALGGF
jgi:CubicO group peptidase (beta-lactamase class C family)